MPSHYRVVSVITGVDGAPFYLTGKFIDDGEVSPTNLINTWHGFVTDGGVSQFPAGCQVVTGPEVTKVDDATGEITAVELGTVASLLGNSSQPLAPGQVQFLIKFRTNTFAGGRRIQGHIHLPCVKIANLSPTGTIGATTITALQSKASALLAGGDAPFCIYSPTYRISAPVEFASPSSFAATLRSRANQN
uniref:Uncharacterized protein n=1 Tax=uncultured prokaryote TaxID=198431 RepID=A0A0H5QNZ1_9ZZZZ|nr:hypothetical protein [uncultured prokaryote]